MLIKKYVSYFNCSYITRRIIYEYQKNLSFYISSEELINMITCYRDEFLSFYFRCSNITRRIICEQLKNRSFYISSEELVNNLI